jgi:signal transduction histidine kinase
VIYRSASANTDRAKGEVDASISLLDTQAVQFRPMMGMRGKSGKKGNMRPPEPADGSQPGRGRWLLTVSHPSGWGDTVVARARWRNLAILTAIFLLMLTMVAALLRITRQSQQLAELQMNFVANVSHELRTPLTVIRTAAHNLKGRLAGNPAQVERYGELIQEQSERLTELVEQVLRFAGARAGNVLRVKEPVAVENVIEDGLRASRLAVEGAQCTVEKNVEPGLPLVMADEVALRHAIQNLLDNAVKYGIEGSNWIGVSAVHVHETDGDLVEIRIADRGPGIPAEEQQRIFDPFFRGSRAVMDQIHGTGLGLNLVKGIVEAHGGTVRVLSEPMKGTEFILRIPAAPPELQDEYAHSFD